MAVFSPYGPQDCERGCVNTNSRQRSRKKNMSYAGKTSQSLRLKVDSEPEKVRPNLQSSKSSGRSRSKNRQKVIKN